MDLLVVLAVVRQLQVLAVLVLLIKVLLAVVLLVKQVARVAVARVLLDKMEVVLKAATAVMVLQLQLLDHP
jgi:hypothetical protein